MGFQNIFGVMLSGYTLLGCGFLITLTTASICPQMKQYYDEQNQMCVNCTVCKQGEMVITPCEIHRNTICGEINIHDLLSLITPTSPSNPHRHHKHKEHKEHRHKNREQVVWKYGDDVNPNSSETSTAAAPTRTEDEVTSSEAPFSSAETLVWDWQAIALASAVFTCFLFFLVITVYSFLQAKQWKRLKENFEADVDELAASLMEAATSPTFTNSEKKNDKLESVHIRPISDGNYLNNRCVYLEQLLNGRKDNAKKSQVGGNVYIEESKTQSQNPNNGRA